MEQSHFFDLSGFSSTQLVHSIFTSDVLLNSQQKQHQETKNKQSIRERSQIHVCTVGIFPLRGVSGHIFTSDNMDRQANHCIVP